MPPTKQRQKTADSDGLQLHNAFRKDDYEQINRKYFDDILKTRSWSALPAGWHNPHSDAAPLFSPRIPDTGELQKYCLDEGTALGEQKRSILQLVGKWENRCIGNDELTLCPSVSTANLLVLMVLKELGIHTIIFETPAYFATLKQAELLNLKVIRLPSFRNNSFEIDLSSFADAIRENGRCAVWITHPRFGIGTSRNIDQVNELAKTIGANNFLIIDEAAEQTYPSILSSLDDSNCTVFRMRGLLKGVGLNGLRISFVLHPKKWRERFEDVLEVSGASIDRFSMASAVSISEIPNLLETMLSHANAQVRRERANVDAMTIGSWIEPTCLENSYIGTLMLDFQNLPANYDDSRNRLLAFCRDSRMPIVLSASIGFAYDKNWEGVRINYFTSNENIEKSIQILLQAGEHLR